MVLPVPWRLARSVRLIAAAICLLLATAAALHRAGSPTSQVAVLVSRHTLAAGQLLSGADVRVDRWPARQVPAGALRSVAAVHGRRTAGAVLPGEPITPARLVGRDLAAGLPPGLHAVPLTVAGGQTSAFVSVGDRVDVYPRLADSLTPSASPRTPAPVARRAVVLAVMPDISARADPGPSGSTTVVVVAVGRADAARIAQADSPQMFAVVLDAP